MHALFPVRGNQTPLERLEYLLGQAAIQRPAAPPPAEKAVEEEPRRQSIVVTDMASAIRALQDAAPEAEVKLAPELEAAKRQQQELPKRVEGRPDLSFIKKWITDNGGDLRTNLFRNRDGSYDAVLSWEDPAHDPLEGKAWVWASEALDRCPTPGLVLFKQVRQILTASGIDRWRRHPQGSSLSSSQGGPGSEVKAEDGLFVIIPTPYVRIANYGSLFDWLEGERSHDYEGTLDRSRATVNVFWGPDK